MKSRKTITLLLALAFCALRAGELRAGESSGSFRPYPRLIVSFEQGTARAQAQEAVRHYGLGVCADLDSAGILILEAPDGLRNPAAAKLRDQPRVIDVEEDFYYNGWIQTEEAGFNEAWLPNFKDILDWFPKIKHPARQDAGEIPWGVDRVRAPQAWQAGGERARGAGVKVAVIDTGIDCSHPDLACADSEGANIIDPTAAPKDDNGHGTHVSGTIAARWNGRGVAGVAPLSRVLPVKVLDAGGGGTLSDIIKGIAWAADHGAQVINMSLGAPRGSKALQQVIQKARSQGVVIVAAAGNEGPKEGTVDYPAAYPEVIAVAASDAKDNVASFSSRGPQVALIAPGVDVLSTVPGGGYAKHSGTSMAAPHVAGLAAIAVAEGAAGPEGVSRALLGAASPLCPEGVCAGGTAQGNGMVDAAKLVR